jgi:hypothetical protein
MPGSFTNLLDRTVGGDGLFGEIADARKASLFHTPTTMCRISIRGLVASLV